VFLAMIEVVVATGMARAERISSARWMDRVCRLVFPGCLVLIGFYAFVWR
ncbi:MAG: hypothetical protein GWO24_04075, partial [Akkermansiaceae bacterium]|nr:hypothetical protein [Akkermansiaceae bacterium]